MADNEGGAGEGDESLATPRSKLRLIVMVVGVLAILGCGAAAYFFLFGKKADEQHAEAAPPPKPPAFVEVPDLLVNLVGNPGDRVQYLKVKVVLEVKEEKQVEAIKPTLPREWLQDTVNDTGVDSERGEVDAANVASTALDASTGVEQPRVVRGVSYADAATDLLIARRSRDASTRDALIGFRALREIH